MSYAIPLLNHQQKLLGFILVAGTPENFREITGTWEADCVFMGSPWEDEITAEPGFGVVAQFRKRGEQRVTVTNDGVIVTFEVKNPEGNDLYLSIPGADLGEWGTVSSGIRTKQGYAHFIKPNDQSATPG